MEMRLMGWSLVPIIVNGRVSTSLPRMRRQRSCCKGLTLGASACCGGLRHHHPNRALASPAESLGR